jgi:hypothetical protein
VIVNRGFRRGLTIGQRQGRNGNHLHSRPVLRRPSRERQTWGESVTVDDDGNIYLGMNGTKGVERYAIR